MHLAINAGSLEPRGGIELCTMQMSIALAERGHRISAFYAEDGVLREELERHASISLHKIPGFELSPLRPINAARILTPSIRTARAERPDVVWLSRYEHIAWAQAVARATRAPLVCHLHHGLNHRLIKPLSRRVDVFIAVSEYMRRHWVGRGIDPNRIVVAHNAVPVGSYPPGDITERTLARQKLGIPDDIFVAAYAGRIIKEKGVDILAEAWRLLGMGPDEARLLIVGLQAQDDPAYVQTLRDALTGSGSDLLPMRADVLPVFHAADVIVVPSRYEEPFGRVIIEGMATGRPVLASRSGAIPEILNGPMDRFLFERGDAAGLAAQLKELSSWRTTEPGLAQECQEWIATKFPFERSVEQVEAILSSTSRGRSVNRSPRRVPSV